MQVNIQRDINCLSDPERGTRRRALEKLSDVLFKVTALPQWHGHATAPTPWLGTDGYLYAGAEGLAGLVSGIAELVCT